MQLNTGSKEFDSVSVCFVFAGPSQELIPRDGANCSTFAGCIKIVHRTAFPVQPGTSKNFG